jgi:hypothetical protein
MSRHSKTFAYEIKILRRLVFADLLIAALDDDVDAQRSASAVIGWLTRHHRGDEADCFACGATLPRPVAAVIVLLPMARADRRAIAGGLCSGCCALSRPDLMDGVMTTITKLMPSARLHLMPAHGGRA